MVFSARAPLLGVLVSLLFAASAPAQERPRPAPSPSPEPPRYEDSIEVLGRPALPAAATTATKLQTPLETLPLSVHAVTASVLETQDARVLGDALENAPGVHVGTGFGVFDVFTLRGFDSQSSGLVLTDGAAEPEASFYHLYNVRRVEVLKGPAAYLYGGNPLSGAVNLIRKQPAAARFADLWLSAGSFGSFEGRLDANHAPASGGSAFRLNALFQQSERYRDDKRSRAFAVNPAASWRLGERTPLTVNLEYVDNSFKPDVGLPIVGGRVAAVPRTRSYQSPFDRSEQGIFRLRVDFETGLGASGTLHNKLYYTDLEWDSDGTLLNGALPGPGGEPLLLRALSTLRDRQRLFGNQLEASWSFATGRARHTLLAGFEASRLQDDFSLGVALLPPIGLLDPVETAAPPFLPLPGQDLAGDTRARVFAPYLVDQISLGQRLRLLAAARFDSLDYADAASATERRESRVSPLLGVLVEASPRLSLYANFAEAFAPPSSLVAGEREPEETTQYEAGLKARLFGGRASLTAAAFQVEKRHIAIPDAFGVARQLGSQRARGVEAELMAELLPGWLLLAGYALTDARLTEFRERLLVSLDPPRSALVDRSGNRVPFAPRNIFNFWTQRAWKSGLGAAAGARYVCTHFAAEDNQFKIGEHWVFDAALSYRMERVELRVNLKNLTGARYFTRGFGGGAVIPADPFAVSAAVRIGLGSRP